MVCYVSLSLRFQGLEIVNPNAAETHAEAEGGAKYFSSSAAFVKVKTPAPVPR